MRVPISWLGEHVDLPDGATARDLADALVRVGLEVESVEEVGADLTGDLVVGRVLSYADEPQSNGKTIRWCSVDVGADEPRGIVCGAHNFSVGDAVVVALPGSVLPGGLAIAARRTYGHVSDGMICSVRELGLGEEHTGILVLSDEDLGGASPGDDARPIVGLPDVVLDIAVTPDRGYCLSVRGVARELAVSLGLEFRDPAVRDLPSPNGDGWPVVVEDPTGCDRFVARTAVGLDPSAVSPFWLRRRLSLAGMRPLGLAVDVTNYVMLELGQPIHGYDRARLTGPIVVRRAGDGDGAQALKLETLDGVVHALDPEDLVIADGSGPIGVAGVMGGSSTELSEESTDVVVEAAHFDPVAVARSARRHKLSTEASRRFERGVDVDLAPAAADRVVELLVRHGGARADAGVTDVDLRGPTTTIELDLDHPTRLVGVTIGHEDVRRHLAAVGCALEESPASPGTVRVTAPSWRPDLQQPADLVEEVARLHGYDRIPSVLPPVVPGHHAGLPFADSVTVARALAGHGFVEVRSSPFGSDQVLDAMGVPSHDPRRHALRLANPLSDEEPLLRTSLLPGLLSTVRRNVGRGMPDLALFETGRVFLPSSQAPPAPRLGVDRRPTDDEVAALDAAVPDQPVHAGLVLTGQREPRGWWGPGRQATWGDALDAVRVLASALRANVELRAAEHAPWHPGRCAVVVAVADDGTESVAGYAGELHPRACAALGVPERTAAAEVELRVLGGSGDDIVEAPIVSTFPVATQDVALVVPSQVPAADVERALRDGAGPLLESVRLFDVYVGDQVPPGHRSLAFALRLRAPDRTLTADDAAAVRDAAVAEATRRTGAVLRA
jgi:phenylalanyl-tRNA synthetase beta chain